MPSSLSSDMQDITENSTKAITQMTTHQVLPTPENYHLWFTYAGNYDLGLRKIVDKLISDKTPINEVISEKLYRKFFSQDAEKKAIAQAGDGFKAEITKIMTILKDAGKDTSSHAGSLTSHIEKLSDFEGSEALKDIIKLVVQDMDNISEQTQKLEKQLEESTDKIDGLKSNLENARIEGRTDALTNIGNRKYFDEKLLGLIETANENKEGFCLIISDIDFFKKFNDTFGHQIGDQVLKVVAHVLKTATSTAGTPYRYGGEEFVILVPNSSLDEATKLAHQIKLAISTKSIKNKNTGQDFGKITMSFGVAQFTKNEIPASIIQRADAALYLAKENGRNRVQIETDLKEEPSKQVGQVG